MKFYEYIKERKSEYGLEISFIDIDETLLNTYAKIHVLDKETGKIKQKLNNQEFNTYVLKSDEKFDFNEFRDSALFKRTSKPIQPMIDRLKNMVKSLKQEGRDKGNKIIFLTARADFDDKKTFLSTFKDLGIDMDFPDLYVERAGNLKTGTVAERKKSIIMKYLNKYNFRRVRMIDDDVANLKQFINITKDKDIIPVKEKVKKAYNISDNEPIIEFFALLVKPTGKLDLYKKEDVI